MTVKELITDLLKAPMDAEVCLKGNQLYIYESCEENTDKLDEKATKSLINDIENLITIYKKLTK